MCALHVGVIVARTTLPCRAPIAIEDIAGFLGGSAGSGHRRAVCRRHVAVAAGAAVLAESHFVAGGNPLRPECDASSLVPGVCARPVGVVVLDAASPCRGPVAVEDVASFRRHRALGHRLALRARDEIVAAGAAVLPERHLVRPLRPERRGAALVPGPHALHVRIVVLPALGVALRVKGERVPVAGKRPARKLRHRARRHGRAVGRGHVAAAARAAVRPERYPACHWRPLRPERDAARLVPDVRARSVRVVVLDPVSAGRGPVAFEDVAGLLGGGVRRRHGGRVGRGNEVIAAGAAVLAERNLVAGRNPLRPERRRGGLVPVANALHAAVVVLLAALLRRVPVAVEGVARLRGGRARRRHGGAVGRRDVVVAAGAAVLAERDLVCCRHRRITSAARRHAPTFRHPEIKFAS